MKTHLVSLVTWIASVVALILLIDVSLSLYKIVVYRDAITSQLDFLMVILIYVGVVASTGLTFLGALMSCQEKLLTKLLHVMIAIAASLAVLLLLTNWVPLPQWSSTAIQNKSTSLLICLVLNGFVFLSISKKAVPQPLSR